MERKRGELVPIGGVWGGLSYRTALTINGGNFPYSTLGRLYH